jgi:hypothetical protein
MVQRNFRQVYGKDAPTYKVKGKAIPVTGHEAP